MNEEQFKEMTFKAAYGALDIYESHPNFPKDVRKNDFSFMDIEYSVLLRLIIEECIKECKEENYIGFGRTYSDGVDDCIGTLSKLLSIKLYD